MTLIILCWLGLDKSELIGDIGSRSFYLRKSNDESPFSSFRSESAINLAQEVSAPSKPSHPLLFPCLKVNKVVRRIWRIWKLVLCSKWWSIFIYFLLDWFNLSRPPKQPILSVASIFIRHDWFLLAPYLIRCFLFWIIEL